MKRLTFFLRHQWAILIYAVVESIFRSALCFANSIFSRCSSNITFTRLRVLTQIIKVVTKSLQVSFGQLLNFLTALIFDAADQLSHFCQSHLFSHEFLQFGCLKAAISEKAQVFIPR
jgi:hypothetical protein